MLRLLTALLIWGTVFSYAEARQPDVLIYLIDDVGAAQMGPVKKLVPTRRWMHWPQRA